MYFVGVVIADSESREVIEAAFTALNSILPKKKYYGSDGPSVILTDDSKAERQALQNVYPEASLLLCSFHILQSVWRWLWMAKQNIQKSDRPILLQHVKDLLYANSDEELDAK